MSGLERKLFQRPQKSRQSPVCEATTPAVDVGERIYAIGDVHGRYDLLDALMEKIHTDADALLPERDLRIVFLGDYIDRGDHSRKVIDFLILLRSFLGPQVEFLAGNHEAYLLSFLDDPLKGWKWLDFGGRQTLASYGVAPPSTKPDLAGMLALRDRLRSAMGNHVAFLQSLPKFVLSGKVVFVHAGLDPSYPLEEQPDAALLWGRIEKGRASGLPGWRMVHGHFAAAEPVSSEGRICVDTGAYYTGRLTAVRLDAEDAFLHADVSDLMG